MTHDEGIVSDHHSDRITSLGNRCRERFFDFKRGLKSYLWNFQIGLWIYEWSASHIQPANSCESGIAASPRLAKMKKYEQGRHTSAAVQKTSSCRVLSAMDKMRPRTMWRKALGPICHEANH